MGVAVTEGGGGFDTFAPGLDGGGREGGALVGEVGDVGETGGEIGGEVGDVG